MPTLDFWTGYRDAIKDLLSDMDSGWDIDKDHLTRAYNVANWTISKIEKREEAK